MAHTMSVEVVSAKAATHAVNFHVFPIAGASPSLGWRVVILVVGKVDGTPICRKLTVVSACGVFGSAFEDGGELHLATASERSIPACPSGKAHVTFGPVVDPDMTMS